MVLEKCPHMTARCPHFQVACNDSASNDCHHIKRTTASMVTAAASLRALGVERLPEAMQEYLKQTVSTYLTEMKMPLGEE